MTIRGENLQGESSTVVRFEGPTGTTDVLASVTEPELVIAYIPFEVGFTPGTYAVSVVARDLNGTRVIGPVTFTVQEDLVIQGPPLLYVPEFLVVEADNTRGATFVYNIPATSSDGSVTLTPSCSPASGSNFEFGTTTVQCSVSDAFGTSSGSFTVVVTDTTPPVVTVPDDIVSGGAQVAYEASAADAIDGPVPVSCSPSSGATFPTGSTLVICYAHDSRFNFGFGFFTVVVTGGPPLINVPPTVTKEATGPGGAVVTYQVTTLDGSPVSCTPPSGSTFAVGSTTVNCTSTNASGTSSASFRVDVVDRTPPTIVAPNILAEATSPAGANVTYSGLSATDLVDGTVAVTCTPASGSFFALSTPKEVSCVASDTRGNGSNATFTVNVVDRTPPTVTAIDVTPKTLWPPDHKMVPVAVSVDVFDVADTTPLSTIVAISSNQPINGTGDGDTAPDWQVTGALTANLRAERAGSNERIYTITVETRDDSGNVTVSQTTVRVMDAKKRSSR